MHLKYVHHTKAEILTILLKNPNLTLFSNTV